MSNLMKALNDQIWADSIDIYAHPINTKEFASKITNINLFKALFNLYYNASGLSNDLAVANECYKNREPIIDVVFDNYDAYSDSVPKDYKKFDSKTQKLPTFQYLYDWSLIIGKIITCSQKSINDIKECTNQLDKVIKLAVKLHPEYNRVVLRSKKIDKILS